MKLKNTIKELIGWYGTFAIIIAFALVSFEILKPTNLLYQLLNLTGSLGIVYISFLKKAHQPAVLNIIWSLIATATIIKLIIT